MPGRRYTLLLIIALSVVVILMLQHFYPHSPGILWGYIIAVALLFKSTLLSLWLVSKLKIIAFLKGLTITQAIALAIKRWFIDNVLSRWIKKHILSHFMEAFTLLRNYYRRLSFKAKIRNTLFLILPVGIVTWLFYLGDMLGSLALTAEVKLLISGFFKALWILIAQVGLWLSQLSQSWLAPLLELFALGFILEWMERKLGPEHPINRFMATLERLFGVLFKKIGALHHRYVTPHLEGKLSQKSRELSQKIITWIGRKKIGHELITFERLQNSMLRGHIDAYHTFPDMAKITDKKELYRRINARTKDNMEIIGFVSRNRRGDLLDEKANNDFYHDLFILEGMASDSLHGVTDAAGKIDHTDFWILNTSRYPVTIESKSGNFATKKLEGKSLELIRTDHAVDKTGDIRVCFRGKCAEVVPVGRSGKSDGTPTTRR